MGAHGGAIANILFARPGTGTKTDTWALFQILLMHLVGHTLRHGIIVVFNITYALFMCRLLRRRFPRLHIGYFLI